VSLWIVGRGIAKEQSARTSWRSDGPPNTDYAAGALALACGAGSIPLLRWRAEKHQSNQNLSGQEMDSEGSGLSGSGKSFLYGISINRSAKKRKIPSEIAREKLSQIRR
jgi:hypothetical protein